MKKRKNNNLRKALGLLAIAALVAGLAAMPLLTADKAPEEEFPLSVLSATAQARQIRLDLRSGGSLTQQEAVSVTVPADVKLTEFLVKNGDRVSSGDPIAYVDRVTVMSAIASTQETLEDLASRLEKERSGSSTDTLKSPGALVKKVYAQAGDSAQEIMLRHGSLATLSLDGRMKLTLELGFQIPAGSPLSVQIGEETVSAAVKSCLDGVLTVTFPDQSYAEGTEAVLLDQEGKELGRGPCEIHAPWNAVAYSGTVSYVNAKEDQYLYEGAVLLGLKDIPYSAAYRSLAAQHRQYADQMLELFQLYQTLTLTAPADGVISGVDDASAQLLSAREGWHLALLKNAPGADPDKEYVNFVGQVTQQGTDGYVVRLNPELFSVTDYTDLSGLSRDTAAMTHEALYTEGAPVYRWNGEIWEESSFSVGDLLLFGGDDAGNVIWVIPYDTAPLPGEAPTEPSEPTQPSEPSEPTEPSEPSEPTEPSQPTQPSEPSQPTEPTQPSEPSEPTLPNLPGGWPGGITIPSFGGYGGYTGQLPGTGQQEQTTTSAADVTVAQVIPQDTMTIRMPIDELDLGLIQLGQSVEVTLEALNATFQGTVTAIGRTGINGGGSSKFTATVTIPREEQMLPGMNASVIIPLETVSGIAIPVAALQSSKSGSVVCTALNPETGMPDQPMEVTLSASDGEFVLVENLPEGTEVWYTYYEALE